jgi:hypothetical protein
MHTHRLSVALPKSPPKVYLLELPDHLCSSRQTTRARIMPQPGFWRPDWKGVNSYTNSRDRKVGTAPKSIGMYLLTTMSSKIDSPSLNWPLMTVSFCPLCMVNHPWRDHAARNQLRMNAISPSSPGRASRSCLFTALVTLQAALARQELLSNIEQSGRELLLEPRLIRRSPRTRASARTERPSAY